MEPWALTCSHFHNASEWESEFAVLTGVSRMHDSPAWHLISLIINLQKIFLRFVQQIGPQIRNLWVKVSLPLCGKHNLIPCVAVSS